VAAVNQGGRNIAAACICGFKAISTSPPPYPILSFSIIILDIRLLLILLCSTEDYDSGIYKACCTILGILHYLQLFNIGTIQK